eukprot:scaffold48_cov311-Pinguiococcus_pyrenoidosus.AAC.263
MMRQKETSVSVSREGLVCHGARHRDMTWFASPMRSLLGGGSARMIDRSSWLVPRRGSAMWKPAAVVILALQQSCPAGLGRIHQLQSLLHCTGARNPEAASGRHAEAQNHPAIGWSWE